MLIIYISVFGAWLFCTILWQFDALRRKCKWLRRLNIGSIFPIWTFFAPNPGMHDTHILVRDKLPNGRLTEWLELDIGEVRKPYHVVWNPGKRKQKLAVDAISEVKSIKIMGDAKKVEADMIIAQIKLSKGYLLLLNLVFVLPRIVSGAVSRQFVVLDASHFTGKRQLSPLFFSPFHHFRS